MKNLGYGLYHKDSALNFGFPLWSNRPNGLDTNENDKKLIDF